MMDISFRPVSTSDEPFVEGVYFETRRCIIEALFGWRGDDVFTHRDGAISNVVGTL